MKTITGIKTMIFFLFLTMTTAMNSNQTKPYIRDDGHHLYCIDPTTNEVFTSTTKIQWRVPQKTTTKEDVNGPIIKTKFGIDAMIDRPIYPRSPNRTYECKTATETTLWSEPYSTYATKPDQRPRHHSNQQNTHTRAQLCIRSIVDHRSGEGCVKFGDEGFKDVQTTACIKFKANANGTDILKTIRDTITTCANEKFQRPNHHSLQQNINTDAQSCITSITDYQQCVKFGYHGFKDVQTTACKDFKANANGTDILKTIKDTITTCANQKD